MWIQFSAPQVTSNEFYLGPRHTTHNHYNELVRVDGYENLHKYLGHSVNVQLLNYRGPANYDYNGRSSLLLKPEIYFVGNNGEYILGELHFSHLFLIQIHIGELFSILCSGSSWWEWRCGGIACFLLIWNHLSWILDTAAFTREIEIEKDDDSFRNRHSRNEICMTIRGWKLSRV